MFNQLRKWMGILTRLLPMGIEFRGKIWESPLIKHIQHLLTHRLYRDKWKKSCIWIPNFEPNEKITRIRRIVDSGGGLDLFIYSNSIFEGLLCIRNVSKSLLNIRYKQEKKKKTFSSWAYILWQVGRGPNRKNE